MTSYWSVWIMRTCYRRTTRQNELSDHKLSYGRSSEGTDPRREPKRMPSIPVSLLPNSNKIQAKASLRLCYRLSKKRTPNLRLIRLTPDRLGVVSRYVGTLSKKMP